MARSLHFNTAQSNVLLLARIFIAAFLLTKCHGQAACPDGWFGSTCTFKCHCNNSATCSVSDGSCPDNDSCVTEYFGPGCQYLDFCNSITSSAPEYLRDCDDRTCNPRTNNTTVYVEFLSRHMFTFIRIVVNNASSLHLITLNLNSKEACIHERRYPVNNVSMDVTCDNLRSLQSLQLDGQGVGYLCSIHVSGGRNLALKQKTWQSSNSSTFPERGLSSHAVDGNRRNILDEQSSCSQTSVQQNASWEVHFEFPAVITNVIIFNRNNSQENGTILRASLMDGNECVSTYTPREFVQPIYIFFFSTPNPARLMKLDVLTSRELTLCEVEAYGEASCEDGTFGLRCEQTCTCDSNQSCSVATGSCSTLCPVGMYGFRCALMCNPNCYGECTDRRGLCKACAPGKYGVTCSLECDLKCRVCHLLTGQCTGCQAGHYGVNCSIACPEHCLDDVCDFVTGQCIECPSGQYGDNCSNPCSDLCADGLCDQTTGECDSCVANRIGPFCRDCLRGWYGANCTNRCSNLCTDRLCDHNTGRCFSCVSNRRGPFCRECPEGKFGPLCDRRCSAYCSNRLCDNRTERCFSCMEGYTGEYCNQEVEGKVPPVWILPLFIPFGAVLVCCFLFGGGTVVPEE